MHSKRSDRWNIIGPGGGGGQFLPTISPHDPDTVLIACDMTGAYITRNGGKSWREFNLRTVVSSFRFDPTAPNVIYAGSSEAGLFRSDDTGESWRLIFPKAETVTDEIMVGDHSSNIWVSSDNWPSPSRITAIRIDNEFNEQIYIAVYLFSAKELRLYHSANHGYSWTELMTIPGTSAYDIFIDCSSPPDARRVFLFTDSGIYHAVTGETGFITIALPNSVTRIHHAAYGCRQGDAAAVFYITTPAEWEGRKAISGVWKSDDFGLTWQELGAVLSEDIAGFETGVLPEFTLLACSETDPNSVYLAAARYPAVPKESATGSVIPQWGCLRSTDGGAAWEWVFRSDPYVTAPNYKGSWVENHYPPSWNGIGPKGIAPLGLGVHSPDPNICWATDMGATYRTLNGGETWEQVYADDHPDGSVSSRGLDVTTCYGVHFDPFDSNHIVVSYTDIGMFHSFNGGETWHHAIYGIPSAWGNTGYWMVFDPEARGRAWGAWGYAHDLPRPKMFRGGSFYLAQGGVSRTDDSLASWQLSNTGMPENSVTTHLLLDPASPVNGRTLYAAVFDKGVFKSTDDGHTWCLRNKGISGNFNAWRIFLLPDRTLILLVSRGLRRGMPVDGAVYKSTDGAESWQRINLPENVNAPNDLACDPANPNRFFLACWPHTGSDGKEYGGGIYETDDGGESWRSVFDAGKHVYGLAIDTKRPSVLFANTFDNGAYRSDDGGRSWRRLRGYNFKWGHSPFIDPHRGNRLYLTTFGSSVWHGPADGDDSAFEDIHPILPDRLG